MGLPTVGQVAGGQTFKHSALHLRAYNLIYNEWFRDENLMPSLPVPKGDGPDLYTDYNLAARGKRHDYFTSCLPWPQKGPSVQLPLGGTAPVKRDASYNVPGFIKQSGTNTTINSATTFGTNPAGALLVSSTLAS